MSGSESPSGSKTEDEDLLAVLRTLAERAGKEILAYYVEAEEIEVREKADASPVTEADEAAEALILAALEKLTPHIPVVAEELAAAGGLPDNIDPAGDFWLVDPLDGTKEFLKRNGEFTVNIALIHNREPIAGVVHAPALAMTWAGSREPGAVSGTATFSQTDQPPMQVAARQSPAEGLTVVASRSHKDDTRLGAFLSSRKIAKQLEAGSSLKFCLLATGQADLYPRFGRTMEWDTAAGQAVLAAAGGTVRDLEGQTLAYGKPGFENPHFVATGAEDGGVKES
ncbi:MAG: 3'(2'),5'-bisphosphate nucleotidase CysQ [Rhodovibrionaceae bacterium]